LCIGSDGVIHQNRNFALFGLTNKIQDKKENMISDFALLQHTKSHLEVLKVLYLGGFVIKLIES
jgi:hypothetical protein